MRTEVQRTVTKPQVNLKKTKKHLVCVHLAQGWCGFHSLTHTPRRTIRRLGLSLVLRRCLSRQKLAHSLRSPQSVFRGGDLKPGSQRAASEQRRELVRRPLKWNMDLWFAVKVAEVWVTFVNTLLPRGVLSLKLAADSVVPGAEVQTGDWRSLLQWLCDKLVD